MTCEAAPAMHDIRFIRENPDAFDEGLAKRGLEPLSRELIALDEARRAAIAALQAAQERRNALSKEIGQAKAKKDEARAQALMAEVARLKDDGPAARGGGAARRTPRSTKRLAEIPNLPGADVPVGPGRARQRREAPLRAARRNFARRRSISSSARPWASWISRPPRSSRARASWC